MSLRSMKWMPRSLLLLMAIAKVSSAAIFAPLLITSTLPNAVTGVSYSARLMISSLNDGTETVNVTGLPAGLSFTHALGNIVITGTPTSTGNFPLTVTATHSVAPLSRVVPFRVDQFATNVTAIDAGSTHTCAVVNGGVQCWGIALLGNNSTASSSVAVRVINPGSGATAVSAGGAHSCAVVNAGLQCWGMNGSGQLGNNSNAQSLVPVAIFSAGSNVTAVSAGTNHTCAVINGGVQCWGQNFAGQLGNNSSADSPVPITVIPPSSGATAVAAGNLHTCAVVAGGVKCWGAGSLGALGNAGVANSLVPATAIASGGGATAVAVGTNHSCAIVSATVYCWGQNSVGQVSFADPIQTTPALVYALPAGTTALAAGQFHNCANAPDGVYCWGSNSSLQIGIHRRNTYDARPQLVVPSNGVATGVAAGSNYGCAIVNGGVQCWGARNSSKLPLGSSATNYSTGPVVTIDSGTGTNIVDGGYDHTCATVPPANVLCWGVNEDGQLGAGGYTSGSVPIASAILPGSVGSSVGAWNLHTCAVVAGGVQCWGYGNSGQLGNGGNSFASPPVVAIPANSNISMVSTGDYHTCALTFAGGVRCWGYNLYGQLGNGGNADSNVPVVALPDGSGATHLSARGLHTCVVVGGGVKCWGRNLQGQLGNNGSADSNVAVTAIAAGSGATAVSAGGLHTCAVVGGGVRCWGHNFYGQLGDNSTSSSPVPVEALPPGSFASYISGGRDHTCAVVSNGVKCWGLNSVGQLGNRSTAQSLTPVTAIAANSGMFSVTAGAEHSCSAGNGGVVCWGHNDLDLLADPAFDALRKVYAAILPPTAPGTPLITSGTAGPGSATLGFTPPASDGGLPIDSYTATCTAPGAVTRSAAAAASATSVVVTGLSGFVQYSCSMTATNGVGTGVASNNVNVVPTTGPLTLLDVYSRKVHGTTGSYNLLIDKTIAIAGAVSVEPRAIGTGHTIVFLFNNPISQPGTVSVTDSAAAALGAASVSFNGNEVFVSLTGIPDNRRATIALAGVNGTLGASAAMGFLVGDVNSTRGVNSSDISGVKARSGQATTAANFNYDVNATGAINSSDISAVKARSGLVLP